MKYYIVTLLKDLPNVKAGFTFKVTGEFIKHPYYLASQIDGMSDEKFNDKVTEVLLYRDKSKWVKIEYDFSKAVKVVCPNCNKMHMFAFTDDDTEKRYEGDGVTSWYENGGLECVCGYKVYTYKTCVNTQIIW